MADHEGEVHVWGSPEGGREPGLDARWCDGNDRGQTVIYHREPSETPHEHWFCTACGFSTWSDEQTGDA